MRSTSYGIVVIMCFAAVSLFAQDLRENFNRSLFADQKATHAGDAVTIYIVESTSASNNASTSSSRSSDFSLTEKAGSSSAGTGFSLAAGGDFAGSGSTVNKGSITAKISARVDSVLPNGNLMIAGNRVLTINGEEQTIHISGVIRTADIQADNSVYSYNVSDAVISIKGDGIVSHSQSPGLLTKLFHMIF